MSQTWIPLPVAASRLSWSWPKTYNAALCQILESRQSAHGRWLVSEASVERVLQERASNPATEAAS
jgi:hypothetical protein